MNLFGYHLKGLIDFQGRENRQPFWLWVLITYGFQVVLSSIVMIPLMSSYFNVLTPLMQQDPDYVNAHPELVQQMVMQAMIPMMRGMMIFTAIMGIMFVLLWAAATVRRLHDGERSGWWAAPVFVMQITFPLIYASIFPQFFGVFGKIRPDASPVEVQAAMAPVMQSMSLIGLLGLLSFVLTIMLVVFCALPGTKGPNRFGDDPLGFPAF